MQLSIVLTVISPPGMSRGDGVLQSLYESGREMKATGDWEGAREIFKRVLSASDELSGNPALAVSALLAFDDVKAALGEHSTRTHQARKLLKSSPVDNVLRGTAEVLLAAHTDRPISDASRVQNLRDVIVNYSDTPRVASLARVKLYEKLNSLGTKDPMRFAEVVDTYNASLATRDAIPAEFKDETLRQVACAHLGLRQDSAAISVLRGTSSVTAAGTPIEASASIRAEKYKVLTSVNRFEDMITDYAEAVAEGLAFSPEQTAWANLGVTWSQYNLGQLNEAVDSLGVARFTHREAIQGGDDLRKFDHLTILFGVRIAESFLTQSATDSAILAMSIGRGPYIEGSGTLSGPLEHLEQLLLAKRDHRSVREMIPTTYREQTPESQAAVWIALADVDRLRDNYVLAIPEYEMALQLSHSRMQLADAYEGIGNCYAYVKDLDRAIDSYERAYPYRTEEPDRMRIGQKLITAYLQKERAPDASNWLKNCGLSSPAQKVLSGRIQYSQRNHIQAEQFFDEIEKEAPDVETREYARMNRLEAVARANRIRDVTAAVERVLTHPETREKAFWDAMNLACDISVYEQKNNTAIAIYDSIYGTLISHHFCFPPSATKRRNWRRSETQQRPWNFTRRSQMRRHWMRLGWGGRITMPETLLQPTYETKANSTKPKCSMRNQQSSTWAGGAVGPARLLSSWLRSQNHGET